jgi:phosphatidylglycerophosphate synthase
MAALGFLVLGAAGPAAIPVALIGEALLWLAAALTLVTGYGYFRASLKHVLPGRDRRAGKGPRTRLLNGLDD